jgi:hypothetical protein
LLVVFPSPKIQDHEVDPLVCGYTKLTVNGTVPEIVVYAPLAVKFATGTVVGVDTLIQVTCADVPLPSAFVAFNEIVKLPIPNEYVGSFVVAKVKAVLFPVTFVAFHCHEVGVFVDVSVKLTGSAGGYVPVVLLAVKEATGASDVR